MKYIMPRVCICTAKTVYVIIPHMEGFSNGSTHLHIVNATKSHIKGKKPVGAKNANQVGFLETGNPDQWTSGALSHGSRKIVE